MSLLESRDAFLPKPIPMQPVGFVNTRCPKCQRVTSYLSFRPHRSSPARGATADTLVPIRRPTRGWSGPVGLPVVSYGRLREDVLQDTARFLGARAARGSSTRGVRLVRDVGVPFGLAMMTLYLLYLLLVAGE